MEDQYYYLFFTFPTLIEFPTVLPIWRATRHKVGCNTHISLIKSITNLNKYVIDLILS
jgi:hypothetical protein